MTLPEVSPCGVFHATRSPSRIAGHLAAPSAALVAAALDERLEALEVGLDAPIRSAELVAQLFLDPVRDEVHLHHDPRPVVVELVESDHPGVVLAVGVAPGDTLVRVLLGDLGVPLVARAADLGYPVQMAVV